MEKIKQIYKQYKEIIMYLIMGGLTTLVNWGTYAGFIKIGSSVTVSNIVAWIAGVLFAYITNKIFVFESYSWKPAFVLKEFFLFVSARFVTGLLEIIGLPFLVSHGFNYSIFGIKGMITKIIVSVVVVILNYIFSKLFIFKKDKTEEIEAE